MDPHEATKLIYERIQSLGLENASKVRGMPLHAQDYGEKEMGLAFSAARRELNLSFIHPSSPSTPPSPSPLNNPLSLSRQQSSSSASSNRLLGGAYLPSPLSLQKQTLNSPSSWGGPSFSDFRNQEDLISPSASTAAYSTANNGINNRGSGMFSTLNSAAPPFYENREADLIDEFQLQDQLSFLDDGSPTQAQKSSDIFCRPQNLSSSQLERINWARSANGLPHRRSCSVSDVNVGCDDQIGGLEWRNCLYFARGYCKNGSNCRFQHVGQGEADLLGADVAAMVGSPSKFEMMEQFQEQLRLKSAQQQQQRLAAISGLMASADFPYSTANRSMNFHLQQQELQAESPRTTAALVLGDDAYKLNRSRLEGGTFGMNGAPVMVNPSSKQIYLTFPADSTFKEEDVSDYFSIYGPVQDVRIPYQQKRMFGFVTFVYPETVKVILAKGNPHFVCDARVLVKPYKEKGKVPDKYRQFQNHLQQMDGGEFPRCGSPVGLDSRDRYELQLGMLNSTQDMLWRRKLEKQSDLLQAGELQRRLVNLQLDVKRNNHHHSFSMGTVAPSPTHSPNISSHFLSSPVCIPKVIEESGSIPTVAKLVTVAGKHEIPEISNETLKDKETSAVDYGRRESKERSYEEENDPQESLEHTLPDSPFASPKAAGEYKTAFPNDGRSTEKSGVVSMPFVANNSLISSSLFPVTKSVDIASFNSCYLQVPRSSGRGTIGM